MNRPLRTALVILGGIVPLAVSAQPATDPGGSPPFEAVFDAESAAPERTFRLAELLVAGGPWTLPSVNGYAATGWSAWPGLPGVPAGSVRIDGIPFVVASVLGAHPELLPVLPGEIGAIRVPAGASTGPGGLAPEGRPDLVTRTPAPGVTVTGRYSVANETGDPGPFRYTDPDLPNVDRTGPSVEVASAWRTGPLRVRAGLRLDQQHVTDPALLDRVDRLYAGYRRPYVSLFSPVASVAYGTGRVRHTARAGSSVLRDLAFVMPFGQEVPVVHRVTTAGAAGRVDLGRGWAWHYAAAGVRTALRPRFESQAVGYDLVETWLDAETGLDRTTPDRTVTIAAGLTRRTLDPSDGRFRRTVRIPRVRFEGAWTGSRRWQQWLAVDARVSTLDPSNPNRLTVSAQWLHRVGRGPVQVDVGAGHLTLLGDLRTGDAFWQSLGWDHPGRGMGRSAVPARLPDGKVWTLDAGVTLRGRAGARFLVAGLGRVLRGVAMPHFLALPDTLDPAVYDVRSVLRTDVDGLLLGARTRLDLPVSRLLAASFSALHVRPVSGEDESFWQNTSPIPRWQAMGELVLAPSRRSALRITGRWRSAARWPAFLVASPAGTSAERLPPRLLLDVTAEKRLWGPHVRGFVSLINLGNRPDRTHPLGPDQVLMMRVGLEAVVGGAPRG